MGSANRMTSIDADPSWRCSEPMPLADIPAAARVAVANIRPYLGQLKAGPAYVTSREAGAGFVEFAEMLLS